MSEILLRSRDLRRVYRARGHAVAALQGVDLAIAVGEHVAIMGRSGSGKSTLLNVLGGLDRAYDGSLTLEGRELRSLSDRQLAAHRGRVVGFVFQSFQLLPHLSVLENVLVPTAFGGAGSDRARAEALLRSVGLDGRMGDRPSQLSGGQQQRVAIARALINRPRLLLCDEPTGNLDVTSSHEVMALLQRVQRDEGTTLIVITHEPHVATYADRVITLEDGRVIGDGELTVDTDDHARSTPTDGTVDAQSPSAEGSP